MGPTVHSEMKFVQGMKPVTDDLTELLLNKYGSKLLTVY